MPSVRKPESESSLRARKQQRAREAIIDAAHELFAERGFDNVTVTDIAERAEVGRTTFFRYFGDKQEVVFAEDQSNFTEQIIERIPGPDVEIGESLPVALRYVRTIVLSYVEALTANRTRFTRHEKLVARHPELRARSLVKQRRYAERLTEQLTSWGAKPAVAALAAEIGLACYLAGHATVGGDPRRLPDAIGAAFDQLAVRSTKNRKSGATSGN